MAAGPGHGRRQCVQHGRLSKQLALKSQILLIFSVKGSVDTLSRTWDSSWRNGTKTCL